MLGIDVNITYSTGRLCPGITNKLSKEPSDILLISASNLWPAALKMAFEVAFIGDIVLLTAAIAASADIS